MRNLVTLRLQNGGPPIAPETMRVIFEPLVGGGTAGENVAHSIGLGLFTARAIVVATVNRLRGTARHSGGGYRGPMPTVQALSPVECRRLSRCSAHAAR